MSGWYAIFNGPMQFRVEKVWPAPAGEKRDVEEFARANHQRFGEVLVDVIFHECEDQNHLLEDMFEAGRRQERKEPASVTKPMAAIAQPRAYS